MREATRIIGRQGYHNTSLDDIADALQVAKGTLYNYVRDKQEILFECHKMSLDLGDEAFAFAEAHGTTGYAKLRLMFRAYLTWLNDALGGGGVASDITALRTADQRMIIVRRDNAQEKLIGFFEEGFADGTVRRIDARLAVYTLMGAVNSIQSWFSPQGRLSLESLVEGVIDILMRGVASEALSPIDDELIPESSARTRQTLGNHETSDIRQRRSPIGARPPPAKL